MRTAGWIAACWIILGVSAGSQAATELGIAGDVFTINGRPAFLLGVSYFDAAHWHAADLDDLAARRFNLIRIFLDFGTWTGRSDESWFDEAGNVVRQDELLNLVRACAARDIIVDVTVLESYDHLPADRLNAIRAAVRALKDERNVFFDLVNEHNGWEQSSQPADTSPHSVMKAFLAEARRENPEALLTFSSGEFGQFGRPHLLDDDVTANAMNIDEELDAGVHILTPHLLRSTDWHEKTFQRVTALKTYLAAIGRTIPVYLQEEQRRGDGSDGSSGDITTAHFLHAVRAARDAGAAGWIFHTAAGFDMGASRFFRRLDRVERETVDVLGEAVFGAAMPAPTLSDHLTEKPQTMRGRRFVPD